MFDDIVAVMPAAASVNLFLGLLGLWLVYRFRLPCYHPLFLFQVYFILGFGVRPLAIWIDGGSHVWERVGMDLTTSDGIGALLAGILFWAAFVFTSLYISLKVGDRHGSNIVNPKNISFKFRRQTLVTILSYILIVCGVIVTWKMIADRGTSIYSFETEIDSQGKQRMVGQSGYFTMMAEWPIIGILLLILSKGVTKTNMLIIIMFFALRMYVGAQRLSFIAIAIMVGIYMIMMAKKRWPSMKLVVPALIILFVFNMVGADRLLLQRIVTGDSHISELVEEKDSKMSGLAEHTAHFVEFDMLCETVGVVPDPLGYNYFTQYLRIFVWPIPRQIWKEKPVDTSLVNFDKLGNFYALTLSCIGDSYTNFGLWGTWVMGCVWAYFLNIVYVRLCNRSNYYIVVLFFSITGYISTVFRDGGVTSIYFILVTIMPAYLIIYLGKPVDRSRKIKLNSSNIRSKKIAC